MSAWLKGFAHSSGLEEQLHGQPAARVGACAQPEIVKHSGEPPQGYKGIAAQLVICRIADFSTLEAGEGPSSPLPPLSPPMHRLPFL